MRPEFNRKPILCRLGFHRMMESWRVSGYKMRLTDSFVPWECVRRGCYHRENRNRGDRYVRADLVDGLLQRLKETTRLMVAERDIFVEGSTNSTGEFMPPGDEEAAREMQAEIDANEAAIAAAEARDAR